jgi:hypothetical protein
MAGNLTDLTAFSEEVTAKLEALAIRQGIHDCTGGTFTLSNLGIDGVIGAKWLNALRGVLGQPDLLVS